MEPCAHGYTQYMHESFVVVQGSGLVWAIDLLGLPLIFINEYTVMQLTRCMGTYKRIEEISNSA